MAALALIAGFVFGICALGLLTSSWRQFLKGAGYRLGQYDFGLFQAHCCKRSQKKAQWEFSAADSIAHLPDSNFRRVMRQRVCEFLVVNAVPNHEGAQDTACLLFPVVRFLTWCAHSLDLRTCFLMRKVLHGNYFLILKVFYGELVSKRVRNQRFSRRPVPPNNVLTVL
ncbi:hypothetical protein [Derxia lacustris]|nr:hypothetical protein [Derxia lacustris]